MALNTIENTSFLLKVSFRFGGFTFQFLDNNIALLASNIEIDKINWPKRPASKLSLIVMEFHENSGNSKGGLRFLERDGSLKAAISTRGIQTFAFFLNYAKLFWSKVNEFFHFRTFVRERGKRIRNEDPGLPRVGKFSLFRQNGSNLWFSRDVRKN